MVHIPRIKFCNLYQIGFVTCTATQDFILWHLWSICSNWNKFNSLNEFVLLCLSSCGCLVRQLTMRRRRLDLEFQWCGANSSWKYACRHSPVKQWVSVGTWKYWQPPSQSGKASMYMTVTQALYFLLSFFWKDTAFSFLRFLLQATIGDRCSSNTEFEALPFRRK